MGTLADIKSSVKTLVAGVSGSGGSDQIDTARIDPDDLPRKLRGTTPYWGLSARSIRDDDKAWGTADRTFFRHYQVELEGWRGIVAADEAQTTWDALVESILDALQGGIGDLAAGVTGFKGFRAMGAAIDVARYGQNSRAHHCVIRFEVRVFERL